MCKDEAVHVFGSIPFITGTSSKWKWGRAKHACTISGCGFASTHTKQMLNRCQIQHTLNPLTYTLNTLAKYLNHSLLLLLVCIISIVNWVTLCQSAWLTCVILSSLVKRLLVPIRWLYGTFACFHSSPTGIAVLAARCNRACAQMSEGESPFLKARRQCDTAPEVFIILWNNRELIPLIYSFMFANADAAFCLRCLPCGKHKKANQHHSSHL